MSVDVKIAAERATARIGSVINGKWQLDRLLGVGGMACVYAATHRNKKRAAIKMLHRELSSDPSIRERFLREGYLANSVGHRGAVAVDDDDVADDGSAFLVMELLDGETLEQRWRRKGERLPLKEVLAACDQVLETLTAAHERGVVHRDLKPENLFLTRDGAVKLLDFGIGRAKEIQGVASTTLAGAAMGTPAFMAPEQARGRWEDVDGRTDLWALGATLFTLLAGEYVHEGETVNETLALACTQSARSLGALRPDLSAGVLAFIDRALCYDKEERFPDARSMHVALRVLYTELFGLEVGERTPLFVPDSAPSHVAPPPPSEARLRQTTARGVTASETPATPKASAPLERRPAVWLGLAGVAIVGVWGLVRACAGAGDLPNDARALDSAASRPLARPVPTVAALAPSTLPPSSASAPPVSVDQLPREIPKRSVERASGRISTIPSSHQDSSVRRR